VESGRTLVSGIDWAGALTCAAKRCWTSKDTFEHVMDLEGVLHEMYKRLKPGGLLYAAIGPLWNSPFGDHDHLKRIFGINLPWAHLIVPQQTAMRWLSRKLGRELHSYRDLGMNMLAFADYKRILEQSGFEILFFKPNNSRHPVLRLFALLARIPFLTEYLTNNLYCILRRP